MFDRTPPILATKEQDPSPAFLKCYKVHDMVGRKSKETIKIRELMVNMKWSITLRLLGTIQQYKPKL